jgi:hypothetical protein
LILAAGRRTIKDVRTALEVTVAILLPTGVGYAVIWGIRTFGWLSERSRTRVYAAEPIERLGAKLCRLRAQLEATENQMAMPAKGQRVRAVRAAYVDVLSEACQRLEVSPPQADSGRVPVTEIYRAEAALRQCGLDVRETAAH